MKIFLLAFITMLFPTFANAEKKKGSSLQYSVFKGVCFVRVAENMGLFPAWTLFYFYLIETLD
ncbi:MAG TPA: hypothetical protein PKD69_09160, partial [Elusimicrobiota bacterium]|nr:hypothetical protein [Elusimicrobiota bacterium]